jgi:hypothetical protein
MKKLLCAKSVAGSFFIFSAGIRLPQAKNLHLA